MLIVGLALAQEPAPKVTFSTPEQLGADLVRVGGQPYTLVFGGTAAALEVLESLALPPEHLLQPLPLLDRDVSAILAATGAVCALVVRPFTGRWLIEAEGACWLRPPAEPQPLPDPGEPTLRVEGPPPPAPPLPPPPPLPPAPPPPRLVFHADITAPGGWWVEAEGEGRLDSVRFADLTRDFEMKSRLKAARALAPGLRTFVALASGTTALAATLVVTLSPPEVEVRARPESADFEDYYTFREAREDWQWRQKRADRRDEQLTSGAVIFGAAALLGVSAPFLGRDAEARARDPGRVYSAEEGAERVSAHNARVDVYVNIGPTGATITVVTP